MYVDEELCEQFGLDPLRVRSIARRISRAALEARSLGLEVYGGSGSGSLRFSGAQIQGPEFNDVASLDGVFDGGDGGDVYGVDSLGRYLGEAETLRLRAQKGGAG